MQDLSRCCPTFMGGNLLMINPFKVFHVDRAPRSVYNTLTENASRINGQFTMCRRKELRMSSILRFIKEEEGAEVVEVGIWLSLIVAASIGLIVTIGGKVKTAFTTISTASF